MQFSHHKGGLQIPQLEIKDKAMKLAWFPRIIFGMDQIWLTHLNDHLDFPIERLLDKPLSWKHMQCFILPGLPVFWMDFLKYWADLNFHKAD